jgi:hypothetical protein
MHQDYDLSAVFMRNWDTRDESGTDRGCEWEQDWEDVQQVCRVLDLPCDLVRNRLVPGLSPKDFRWTSHKHTGTTSSNLLWTNGPMVSRPIQMFSATGSCSTMKASHWRLLQQ